MKILVENSGYGLTNMGDVAMLQVGVARLQRMFPRAEIHVVTRAPKRLETFCNGCVAVSAEGVDQWKFAHCVPFPTRWRRGKWAKFLDKVDFWLKFTAPDLALLAMRSVARITRSRLSPAKAYRDLIDSCDVVVAAGGGYFTDSFQTYSRGIMLSLRLALLRKKKIVVLGQGLGPLTDHAFGTRLARILKEASLITLREGIESRKVLERFGVSERYVRVTGDDAIPVCACSVASPDARTVGLNLRVSGYANVGSKELGNLGDAMVRVLSKLRLIAMPVPIELSEEAADAVAIEKLVSRSSMVDPFPEPVGCPQDVIERISRCRVMITGSYHAGVFALSLGIPIVGLVHSAYYSSKFAGLRSQFGENGVLVVDLSCSALFDSLLESVEVTLDRVQAPCRNLIQSAKRQVVEAEASFELLREMFRDSSLA